MSSLGFGNRLKAARECIRGRHACTHAHAHARMHACSTAAWPCPTHTYTRATYATAHHSAAPQLSRGNMTLFSLEARAGLLLGPSLTDSSLSPIRPMNTSPSKLRAPVPDGRPPGYGASSTQRGRPRVQAPALDSLRQTLRPKLQDNPVQTSQPAMLGLSSRGRPQG